MARLAPVKNLEIVELTFAVPTAGIYLSRYERVDLAWIRLDYVGEIFLRKVSLSNVNASKELHLKLRAKWRIKKMLLIEHVKLLERLIRGLFPGQAKVVALPPRFPPGEYVVGPRSTTVRVTCSSSTGEFEVLCLARP